MKNVPLLFGTLAGTLALILGISFFFSKTSAPQTVDASVVMEGARHFYAAQSAAESVEPSPAPEASPLASPEATEEAMAEVTPVPQVKVTVVEFSDFECPACKAANPIRDQLFAQYPGQIEFVYRHFPLTQIHPNAQLAAQAAETAARFDQFWPMHDLLFERQEDWSTKKGEEFRELLISYAEELGMDSEEFANNLESDTVKQAVQSDVSVANQLQVNATPTFFINGQKVSAPEVFSTVESVLNSLSTESTQ